MRIQYDEIVKELERVLSKKGMDKSEAFECAKLLTNNSLDGVYSHGLNRFPRLISYIDKGYVKVKNHPEKTDAFGAFERWEGNYGMGNLNASLCANRVVEIAKENGIGIVAMGHTNHWMRGGTYGWQIADAGMIGICWTNTIANMPAWGAIDRKIGNNPFIMSIPKSDGHHVVIDCALAQFSYGKIEEYRLKEAQLPVAGGFDSNGNTTCDPAEIEKTGRVLPIGYWKGSGLSIALDLIATILSAGFSTTDIGKNCEDEYGLSQVFIAIDPKRFSNTDEIDRIITSVLDDVKSSEGNILYPGESSLNNRIKNKKEGIPVVEEIWESIKNM